MRRGTGWPTVVRDGTLILVPPAEICPCRTDWNDVGRILAILKTASRGDLARGFESHALRLPLA
jgi:hypothetical protein